MAKLEQVRKLAGMIADRYSLTVPVDLTPLMNEVCTLEKRADLDVDGYTILDCKPPKMVLRADVYPRRERFTIAHELGHILIPWHNGRSTYADRKRKASYLDRNEIEADTFAAELLLPRKWLAQYLQESSGKLLQQQIYEITEMADVSVLACIRSLQQHWSKENLLFYTLPDWEYYQRSIPGGFHFALYRPTENRTLAFYKCCATLYEEFQYGAYRMAYFQFLQLPAPEELVSTYRDAGCDMARWILQLTNGYSARVIPFLDTLLSCVPDRIIALVFLNGHKATAFCSKSLNGYYFPETSNYEVEKENAMRLHSTYMTSELDLNGLGKLFCLKAPYNVVPDRRSSNPNLLLRKLLAEVYQNNDERKLAGRKVNGFLGGNNNRKEKGSMQEFYDELFDRMRTEPILAPLLQHADFPAFLFGKIFDMLSTKGVSHL